MIKVTIRVSIGVLACLEFGLWVQAQSLLAIKNPICFTQRLQYPLITEYTLHCNGIPNMM